MVLMPADPDTEAGVMPPPEVFEAMIKYNAELAKAGVLLGAEGLLSSDRGAAVRFDDAEKRTVLDGPFTEAKEMIAGFWLLQTSSLEECLEWVKRAPVQGVTLQIRQIAGPDDFGPEFTPELREAEQQVRSSLG
jgi:hypothetical protein